MALVASGFVSLKEKSFCVSMAKWVACEKDKGRRFCLGQQAIEQVKKEKFFDRMLWCV